MRSSLVCLSCLLLGAVPVPAAADYSPPSLADLVMTSDAIVAGEIIGLTAGSFDFRVDARVVGPVASGQTMRIGRFQDWTCAARWAPYAVGQQAVIFLEKQDDGTWRIRSGGGEGEMPVVTGRVFVNGYYGELAPAGTNAFATQTVHGGTYSGFTLDRDAFLGALRRARACHRARVSSDRSRRLESVHRTCGPAAVRAARSTALGAALFDVLRR